MGGTKVGKSMLINRYVTAGIAALGATLVSLAPATAQGVYKVGMAAGLTGYAATVDRAWRDGGAAICSRRSPPRPGR